MAKDYQAQLLEMAGPHCDGPVVAAAGVMPRGLMGGMLLRKISPAAGWAKKRHARAQAPDLPKSAMLAVTDQHVYILECAVRGRSSTVTGVVKRWDRADVTASTSPGRTTIAIDLDISSTGEHYALESLTLAGGSNSAHAVAAALGQPV